MDTQTPETPKNTVQIVFSKESSTAGVNIMARLFTEGWETLEPLKYYECCRQYYSVLVLPSQSQLTFFHVLYF